MTYSGGVENSKIITSPNNPTIIQNKCDRQGDADDCLAMRIEFLTTSHLSQKINQIALIYPFSEDSLSPLGLEVFQMLIYSF